MVKIVDVKNPNTKREISDLWAAGHIDELKKRLGYAIYVLYSYSMDPMRITLHQVSHRVRDCRWSNQLRKSIGITEVSPIVSSS